MATTTGASTSGILTIRDSPLKMKGNDKRTEEEETKQEITSTNISTNNEVASKLAAGLLEARQSLVNVLMDHRFKQRFSSTAFTLDTSLNNNAAAGLPLTLEENNNNYDEENSCAEDEEETKHATEPTQRTSHSSSRSIRNKPPTQPHPSLYVTASNSFASCVAEPGAILRTAEEQETNYDSNCKNNSSITPEERKYLEKLILEGDVEALQAARDCLSNPNLFPIHVADDTTSPSSSSCSNSNNKTNHQIKRRDSKIQQTLFQIHQEHAVQPSMVLEYLKKTQKGSQQQQSMIPRPPSSTANSRALQYQADRHNSLLQSFGVGGAGGCDDDNNNNNSQGRPQSPPATTRNNTGCYSSRPLQFHSSNSVLRNSLMAIPSNEDAIVLVGSGAETARSATPASSSFASNQPELSKLPSDKGFTSRALQFQSMNSILQGSMSNVEGAIPPVSSGGGAGGSWDPLADETALQRDTQNNYDDRDDAQEPAEGSAFVDPFHDIASWIDGGQGVEVNDSGIPLLGRSSSTMADNAAAMVDNSSRPFAILGTSADDVSCHPHVMSPPLMDSLLAFMPEAIMEWNYWLKYSLVRDGANLWTMLRQIRASNSTVLAIETVDGHVFGAFTNHSWRFSVGWYGGQQAFLWKMRRSRLEPTNDIIEQAALESEVQVFPVRPGNVAVQYCSKDCLMLGRGEIQGAGPATAGNGGKHYGHGIYLHHSLQHGTTSSSETFGNPCLVDGSERGSRFDVSNIEVWTLTPHDNVVQAQQSELSTLFLEGGRQEPDLNVLGILVGGTI